MDSAKPLGELARDFADERITSAAVTRECLARIADPAGEGARSFTQTYEMRAIEEASASDRLRQRGPLVSPLAGIPISIKDLFDVAGEVTTAGSVALAGGPVAPKDAVIVQRLRAAGAVILGKTNMTEFAYSALGLNPHHGTPRNPHDRSRIPGGSSSGAATAVAYGLCAASIGTDTAGSIRVPAAFCGLVGFKPTQQRVPRVGAFALSESLDSIGSVTRTVECCVLLDAVMAGMRREPSELPIAGLRLAIPEGIWTEGLDRTVARAFERTLERLAAAGAQLIPHDFPLGAVVDIERSGAVIGAEAYAAHRTLLGRQGASYDPRVRARLEQFKTLPAADYLDAVRCRREAVERFSQQSRQFDAVLAPTVAVVPPRFDELEHFDDYRRINALVRRNAALVNLLGGCALSVPCHGPRELPVGLMIVGGRNTDAHVLAIGMAIERLLAETR